MEAKHVFVPIVPDAKPEAEARAFVRPGPGGRPSAPPRGGIAHWWFRRGWDRAPDQRENDERLAPDTPDFVQQVAAATTNRCRTEAKNAYACVQPFDLKPSWWRTPRQYRLSWRMARPTWMDAVDVTLIPSDVDGWEGGSTTLGLALGLLMAGSECGPDKVLATGDLGSRGDNDVGVKKIGSLGRKLHLVEDWGRAEKAKAEAEERTDAPLIPFFIPLQDLNQQVLSRADFDALFWSGENPWGQTLKDAGIQLIGVATLGEAAAHLGAHRLPTSPGDRLDRFAFILATIAILAGVAYGVREWRTSLWRNQAIAGGVTFAPVVDVNDRPYETPYRTGDRAGVAARPLCANDGLIAGESLHLNMRLGDGTAPDVYWPTVLTVPADPDHPHTVTGAEDGDKGCDKGEVPSGQVWACSIGTKPDEFEDMAVIVIADRQRDISDDLGREVKAVKAHLIDETAKGRLLNLRDVINHFAAAYPGRVAARIISLLRPEECKP